MAGAEGRGPSAAHGSEKDAVGWYWGKMDALGWAETLPKLAGMASALAGLAGGLLPAGGAATPGIIVSAVLMSLCALLLVLGIADRCKNKEIFSMGFILVNVAAHVAVLLALFSPAPAATTTIVFFACYAVGDLVKEYWLRSNNITQDGASTAVLMALTAVFVVTYVLSLVLVLAGV